MEQKKNNFDRFLFYALYFWGIVSLFFIINNILIITLCGREFYSVFTQPGSLSDIYITFGSIALVWFSLGAILTLFSNKTFRMKYGIQTIYTWIIILLYINICRERTFYDDTYDYVFAAFDLIQNKPFNSRYIYLPFLANMLEPFARLGLKFSFGVFWASNIFSLGLFSILLPILLQRYGFSQRLAKLLVFLFLVVNVAVLRTLFYGQVNFHVANLMIMTLLFYPKYKILSALSLAMAIHLKMSPAVLVLPFLLQKDIRWLSWFTISMLGLASITLVTHGIEPFFSSWNNIQQLYNFSSECFRDNSINSFIDSSAKFFGISFRYIPIATTITKGILFAAMLWVMIACIKKETFQKEQATSIILNSSPILLILMLLASPLIWEHHPIFASLSYLIVILKLHTPTQWLLYCMAYFFTYLVPTFDFYPWSYGRLFSSIILTYLLYRIPDSNSQAIIEVEDFLEQIQWKKS